MGLLCSAPYIFGITKVYRPSFSQHDALCFSTSFEIGPNQSDYFLKLHLIQESITKVFQDILPLFPEHSQEAKLINICPGNILIFVEVI